MIFLVIYREGISSFLLVLDGNEDVVYGTIAKYIKKFTPKVFIKNLIVLINRAEEPDRAIGQFFQAFKDYLDLEYADESMRNYIKGQVNSIPRVNVDKISDEVINSSTPDDTYIKLISLIQKRGASKYYPE